MADDNTTATRGASPDTQGGSSVNMLATTPAAVQSRTAASATAPFVSGPNGTFFWYKKLPVELRNMIWKARLRSLDILRVEFDPRRCDHPEAKGLLREEEARDYDLMDNLEELERLKDKNKDEDDEDDDEEEDEPDRQAPHMLFALEDHCELTDIMESNFEAYKVAHEIFTASLPSVDDREIIFDPAFMAIYIENIKDLVNMAFYSDIYSDNLSFFCPRSHLGEDITTLVIDSSVLREPLAAEPDEGHNYPSSNNLARNRWVFILENMFPNLAHVICAVDDSDLGARRPIEDLPEEDRDFEETERKYKEVSTGFETRWGYVAGGEVEVVDLDYAEDECARFFGKILQKWNKIESFGDGGAIMPKFYIPYGGDFDDGLDIRHVHVYGEEDRHANHPACKDHDEEDGGDDVEDESNDPGEEESVAGDEDGEEDTFDEAAFFNEEGTSEEEDGENQETEDEE